MGDEITITVTVDHLNKAIAEQGTGPTVCLCVVAQAVRSVLPPNTSITCGMDSVVVTTINGYAGYLLPDELSNLIIVYDKVRHSDSNDYSEITAMLPITTTLKRIFAHAQS